MSVTEKQYSPDKPKDCKFCYWYEQRKGCTYSSGCYYELKPKKSTSPCEGCPYGVPNPCIGYCMKEVMKSVKFMDKAK